MSSPLPPAPLPPAPLWLTSALYYAAWFLCVGLAARGHPWLAALSHALFGLWVIASSPGPRAHLYGALTWALGGYVIDSALTLIGVIRFPPTSLALGPSPMWMVSLWFTFGALLSAPLRSLLTRPALAVALGAIGGPVSYMGGARTGAMEVLWSAPLTAATLGAVWAGVMWGAARAWGGRGGSGGLDE